MVKEIWFTTTAKGNKRAWFFAGRALPIRMADAELGLANGTLKLVSKPEWLGK